MMWFTRMRLAAAACSALLACTSAACDGGDGGRLPAGMGAFDQEQVRLLARLGSGDGPEPARARSETTVKIALTGLILMMPPPANQVGPTQLFMPSGAHAAYVAFRRPDGTGCTYYNDEFDICFLTLENSRLAPLGRAAASPAPHGIPTGVVNLSHGSGPKADTADINQRIRARASLLSGRATDSCALASWSFDPLGQSVKLPSVLTWEMDTPEGDSLVLLRQPLNAAGPPERKFVLHANGGPIELLILHLTAREFYLLRTAKPGSGTTTAPELYPAQAEREVEQHFTHIYNMMRAPTSPRPFPRAPIKTGHACAIPVLGLDNAVYEAVRLREREQVYIDGRRAPTVHAGVRTFSCVMALAEGS